MPASALFYSFAPVTFFLPEVILPSNNTALLLEISFTPRRYSPSSIMKSNHESSVNNHNQHSHNHTHQRSPSFAKGLTFGGSRARDPIPPQLAPICLFELFSAGVTFGTLFCLAYLRYLTPTFSSSEQPWINMPPITSIIDLGRNINDYSLLDIFSRPCGLSTVSE
jgi:hypothetical protein